MKRFLIVLKQSRELVSYVFFGIMTTLINYCVYLPLFNLAHLSATMSNLVAWVVAVSFAYVTNKPWVFQSHDWSLKTVIPELGRFIGCRVGSGLVETLILFTTVDLLKWDGNWMKLAVNILVVIMNYIASKWLVFGKK